MGSMIREKKNKQRTSESSPNGAEGGRWSDLPPDLVLLMSQKLTVISDIVRFRCVCRSWRSATSEPMDLTHQHPWLMLPDYDPIGKTSSFYSRPDDKVYTLYLPELDGAKIVCGSSHGWLVVLDVTKTESVAAFLLNPLTRAQVQLPPVTHFPYEKSLQLEQTVEGELNMLHFEVVILLKEYAFPDEVKAYICGICHASLSSSPKSSQDCVVMAVLPSSCKFAFCRPGDDAWIILNSGLPNPVSAVAYHKKQFYILDNYGNTAICHDKSSSSVVATLIPSMKLPNFAHCNFARMMESSTGELLLLAMFPNSLSKYLIFRLDIGQLRWSEVTSMLPNDLTLFISWHHYSSFVLPGAASHIYYLRGHKLYPAGNSGNGISMNYISEIYRSTALDNTKFIKDADFEYILSNLKAFNSAQSTTPCWIMPTP